MIVDALEARVREFTLAADPDCPLHGIKPTIFDVVDVVPRQQAPLGVPEIEPRDLDAFLEATPNAQLLDVREPHEAVLGAPPDAIAVPATELEARMHELDSAKTYVIACRVGAKSRWAAQRLHDAGFRRLYHLRGGLLAYAVSHDDFEIF